MREPIDGPVLAVMRGRLASTRRSRWPTTATTASARRCGRPTATRGMRIARELHAGMVWLNDHLPGPDGLARAVGRGGGRRARAHARRGRAARVRAGEADHVGPAAHARPVVGALRRDDHPRPRARSPSCARAREADRERAWREGALALTRLGARAFGRGAAARTRRSARARRALAARLEPCPPRPMQARSASASCAGGSATRAASRGCSRRPFYIACLRLTGRRCVVVGGGEIGLEKVEGLLACDGEVTLIAPEAEPALQELRARGLDHAGSSARTPAPPTSRAPSWRSPRRTTPT